MRVVPSPGLGSLEFGAQGFAMHSGYALLEASPRALRALTRARVVDVAPDALTIEATGTAEKLDALLRDLEPYGIKEMVQSGVVAIGRGSRSITAPVLRAAS